METVLFYGVPEGCSFGSIVALEWSGLPYRLCRIEMPRVVSGEAFRRINPVGETPALRTPDGRTFSESMAILNHIAARSLDKGLGFPQGTPGFDRLNSVLAFLNTGFFESFAPLWYALEHGASGAAAQPLVDMGRDKVRKAHASLDALLGDAPWLAGAQRTVADAYFMGIARWNDFHRVLDRRDYPRVARLHDKLLQDPAVRFAHAIEHGEPAAGGPGFLGEVRLEDMLRPADR